MALLSEDARLSRSCCLQHSFKSFSKKLKSLYNLDSLKQYRQEISVAHRGAGRHGWKRVRQTFRHRISVACWLAGGGEGRHRRSRGQAGCHERRLAGAGWGADAGGEPWVQLRTLQIQEERPSASMGWCPGAAGEAGLGPEELGMEIRLWESPAGKQLTRPEKRRWAPGVWAPGCRGQSPAPAGHTEAHKTLTLCRNCQQKEWVITASHPLSSSKNFLQVSEFKLKKRQFADITHDHLVQPPLQRVWNRQPHIKVFLMKSLQYSDYNLHRTVT